MGGPSFKTEIDHKKVYESYLDKIKGLGSVASYVSRQYFYDELSDEYGYTAQTIKKIINKFNKKKPANVHC